MALPHKAALYFHTLRYLKPIQVWARVAFRLHSPVPDLRPAPRQRLLTGQWCSPAARRQSLLSETRLRFLNEEREVAAGDWNSATLPKLWLYNLHYFDDLNAVEASTRTLWHKRLLERWVAENPAGEGIGWEPYPTSLRIINWVKWALAGNALSAAVVHSLTVQARWLARRLEWHLLGNHLFANAKALVFAGAFFEGDEADEWFRLGMGILDREIPEQMLADGGHFERSTMYHALAFEDMLDLVNLTRACPAVFTARRHLIDGWPDLASKMGRWLAAMSHPDGGISFFNDAAIGIAPPPIALFRYAQRLGIPVETAFSAGVVWLRDSGYVRAQQGDAVLIVDVAKIGPDYLPGHAHADTLSFELSVKGQRVLVNSGTSRYGLGPEREWERSTAAHNTVEMDGKDSSEIWAGFRVARRAYPFDIGVEKIADSVIIQAAHDGYRRLTGRPVHRRRWLLGPKQLEVTDRIEGRYGSAVSRIYFHPDVRVEKTGVGGSLSWGAETASLRADGCKLGLVSSHWHPEFGLSLPSTCLEMKLNGDEARFRLVWT